MASKIKVLEEHRLSDGGLALVTRLGWSYTFCRIFPNDQAPDDTHGLNRKEAYDLFEKCIKNDVLETE